MKQFFLNEAPDAGGMINLYGKDYHYLAKVLRLKKDSSLDAILPDGKKTRLKIVSLADNFLSAECIFNEFDEAETQTEKKETAAPKIILFQGLPKSPKMDLIIRQAAEGGILLVAPFQSDFSTVRLNDKALFSVEKFKRWERIVREARQQSGSQVPTIIKKPCSVDEILEYWRDLLEKEPETVGIILHQEVLAEGTFHGYLYNNPSQVVLAVGPEGGFSPEEAGRFIKEGFKPLTMGSTILRTETAALYGAAAVRIILLENASWALKKTKLRKKKKT